MSKSARFLWKNQESIFLTKTNIPKNIGMFYPDKILRKFLCPKQLPAEDFSRTNFPEEDLFPSNSRIDSILLISIIETIWKKQKYLKGGG